MRFDAATNGLPRRPPGGGSRSGFIPYPPLLLPAFYFEDECYAVECHAQAYRQVHFIYLDEYWVCYDRLADLLAAKLKCYQASWIYMRDTDGYGECADRAACAAILPKHDPCRAAELRDGTSLISWDFAAA